MSDDAKDRCSLEAQGAMPGELGIEHVLQHGSGWALVAGRCYRGPIRVGTLCTLSYRYDVHRVDSEYRQPSERHSERVIRLILTRLNMYGREFSEIDEGMVAEVRLEGEDTSHVQSGDVLAFQQGP